MQYLLLSSRRGKVLVGTIIGGLAWVLMTSLYYGNLLESYELKTYDQLCRLKASNLTPPKEIVLVVVDQGSLKAAERQGVNWPWPRQMYAPILEFCASSGARAVAFDIVFTEPSVYGVEDDKLLAEALKANGHAFLPIFLSRESHPPPSWEKGLLDRIALPLGDQSGQPISPYISSEPPIQILAESAYGLGNVAIPPDLDGIYRRLPAVFSYRGHWIPSLGMAAYRHLSENDPVVLKRDGLHVKGIRIPLDDQKNFLLSFYGTPDFQRFSAYNVIQSFLALQEGRQPIYPAESFRDKIVFVGFTAPGLYDLKPTPISSVNPGMAIHATLVANLLHRDFRVRVSPFVALVFAFIFAAAMGIAVMLIPSLWQLALLALAYTGGGDFSRDPFLLAEYLDGCDLVGHQFMAQLCHEYRLQLRHGGPPAPPDQADVFPLHVRPSDSGSAEKPGETPVGGRKTGTLRLLFRPRRFHHLIRETLSGRGGNSFESVPHGHDRYYPGQRRAY